MLGVLILRLIKKEYIVLRKDYSLGINDKFYLIPTINISKCNRFIEIEIDIFKFYMYIVISYENEE